MKIGIPPLIGRKDLHISNDMYYLDKLQEEGERDLQKISEDALREDSWIFLKDTQRWFHLQNIYYEKLVPSGIEISGSTKLPKFSSMGSTPIFYHIHPDKFVDEYFALTKAPDGLLSRNFMHAFYALPSQGDLSISLNFPEYDCRIATSKGITKFKANTPNALEINVDTIVRKNTQKYVKIISERGFILGLFSMFDDINTESQDSVRLSFYTV